MRQGTVELYASIFNNDIFTGDLTGTIEQLVEYVQNASPKLPSLDVKRAILEATWTKEVVWLGGHSIGIKVKEVEHA